MSHDWTQFTRRIDIKASKEAIYHCWSTPSGYESWFLRSAKFTSENGNERGPNDAIEKGDSYRWLWHGWDDDTVENGTILEANGEDEISFTFEKCEVTVRIYEEANTVICELTQSQVPTDEASKINYYIGCSSGWSFFMTNMKSILEGGVDLRNRNEALRNMINA